MIVAGKYGSIDPEENISYTEKEYRYAIHKKMPILAFLHKNIDSLPAIKVGATDEERERVKNFHNTVKEAGRLVDFYSNEDELKYKIAMAMPKIINDAPMPGWVRADQAEKAIATAGDTDGIRDLQRQLEKIQNTILEKVEQTQMKWEPISKEEIDAMFSSEKKELKIPILSDEAKCLLTEAAKDDVGQILVINSLEGVDIQTNNKIMNTDKIGKSATIWKKAVSELQNNQLIMAVGNKNEIFQLTRLGYEVSEKI